MNPRPQEGKIDAKNKKNARKLAIIVILIKFKVNLDQLHGFLTF